MTSSISTSVIRVVLIVAALLVIPVLGNQFVEGWNWSLSDFVIMGTMLVVVGSILELIFAYGGKYKLVAAAVTLFLFLWLWAELAVGVFTNWGS